MNSCKARHFSDGEGGPREFYSNVRGQCPDCEAREFPTEPPTMIHRRGCEHAERSPDRSTDEAAMTATGAHVVGGAWARCVPQRNPTTVMVGLISRLSEGALAAIPIADAVDAAAAIAAAATSGKQIVDLRKISEVVALARGAPPEASEARTELEMNDEDG